MSELTATIDERAAAAQAAHEYAWRRQRQADRANDPISAGFWADTCTACLRELEDLVAARRAGLDPLPESELDDGIQRSNADLSSESAYYVAGAA